MNNDAAAPSIALDRPGWGVPLSREELDSTVGGILPVVGWIVGALAVSIVVGMVDRLLFGGCTCR